MTPYFFLLAYATGVAAALFRGPIFGIYLYVFSFYFTPYRTWWEDLVPDLRYLQIAAIVTLISTLIHGTWSQPHRNRMMRGMWIFIALWAWMWLTSAWAITGDWQALGRVLFTKHLFIAVLIVVIIRNTDELKNFVLANVVGCAWLGWLAWGKSGSRLEGLAGALGDANTLGMHLGAGLILAAMMFLGAHGYHRLVSFLCLPLILNTVILSGSRGAFLGLLAGGLIAGFYCPKGLKLRFSMAGCLGVVMMLMLASNNFIERMSTLVAFNEGAEEVNETSGHRLDIAGSGWQMFLDHKLGTGFKGTAVLSPQYMPPELLAKGTDSRSAHNSLMSILVDYSVVGLLLYLWMYLWALRKLRKTRNWAMQRGEMDHGMIAAGVAGAFMVVMVAGQSSDYYYAEIQYWLLAVTTLLLNFATRAATSQDESVAQMPGRVNVQGFG